MGMNTTEHTRGVLVVGAGYAGLLAANRLAGRGAHVTLVNERDTFVDRIRLHEVIAGTRVPARAAPALRPLLRQGVELATGRAVAVGEDESGAWARLDDGRTLAAGHLLLCVGSGAGPGGWEWALDARDRIAALPPGGCVAVTGAGLTGLEVATEVAEARPDLAVTLADPAGIGRAFSDAGRRHLLRTLDRLGVRTASVAGQADATVDCTGLTVPGLAAGSGLPVTAGGAVIVDDLLRVDGRQRIWAAGDGAHVPSQPHLRMACATAAPMAAHAADQILRAVGGQPLRPVSIGFTGQCLSLGRGDGLLQPVGRDDSPRPWVLTGRAAAVTKEAVCRLAAAAPARWGRHYRGVAGPRTAAGKGR